MRQLILTGLLLFLNVAYLIGQEESNSWDISLSGFLNAQLFSDSRQIVGARADMFALYPRRAVYDEDGKDINSKGKFNQAAMTTRLRTLITAPNVWGARSSALIEVDFTGVNDLDLNGLRLREGWIKLQWRKTEVLIGLYWHPMFVDEVRPKTISLNLGAPYHPFSRHNQVRIQQSLGKLKLIAVAASQIEFANYGPVGRNAIYLINAAVPNFDLQIQYQGKKYILGAGVDYKQLLPRLSVELIPGINSKSNDKIHSYAATLFAKVNSRNLIISMQGVWGQNLTEHIMLGGYIENQVDTATNRITYANTEQFSVWADMITTGKKFRVGLFAGYAKNLGYTSPAAGELYTRGNDIDYSFRVSPRLQFHFHKLLLASEFEYTAAAYGDPDINGNIDQSELVGNFRILLGVFYFF